MLTRGDVVGGYRVDDILGHGGMGVVYKATQLSLDRMVALKVVDPRLAADPVFRERFRSEGRVQAALEHPHIITIYEAGETDDGLFIAMRLVDGYNLKELLVAGDLVPRRALAIVRQIADALDAAHEAGLVHRDVKPQNILVDRRGHAYLADFGLTKTPGQRSLTQSGHFVGSLDYISPEQIQGRPATAESDIYSLGAVMYECLTGAVPFPRESEAAILFAHLSDPLPPPSSVNPLLPEAINDPVSRALSRDPEERYQLATDFLDAVERAAGSRLPDAAAKVHTQPMNATTDPVSPGRETPVPGGPTILDRVHAPAPPPASAPPRPRFRPHRAHGAAVAVVLALTGAGFAVGKTTAARSSKSVVHTSRITLTLPPGWTRAPSASPARYGMHFADPLLVAGPDGASLTAGTVKNLDTLPSLPQAAAYALTVNAAYPREASIADARAYAYVGTDRHLLAFFVPTTDGVIAMVCESPLRTAPTLATCGSIVRGSHLARTTILALGPNASDAHKIQTAVSGAETARARQLRVIRKASSSHVQAVAAGRISADYKHYAALLRHLQLNDRRLTKPVAGIATALETTSAAYRSLANAATHDSRTRYIAARNTIRRDEADINARIAALRRLGYRTTVGRA